MWAFCANRAASVLWVGTQGVKRSYGEYLQRCEPTMSRCTRCDDLCRSALLGSFYTACEISIKFLWHVLFLELDFKFLCGAGPDAGLSCFGGEAMIRLIKFLLKWQIVFFFLAVFFGLLLIYCEIYMVKMDYYGMAVMNAGILGVILAVLTTLRGVIYILSKLSNSDLVNYKLEKFDELKFVIDRPGFAVFLIKFFGMNVIGFCYTVIIFSLFVFMKER